MAENEFKNTIYKINNSIIFTHDVYDESIGYLIQMIDGLVTKEDLGNTVPFKYNLVVNSPGGLVDSGLFFYDYINKMKKKHSFTTIASGVCASMGVIMLLAGDVRKATPNTQILMHPISGGLQGTYEEIEAQKRSLDIMNKQLKKIVGDVVGLDEEKVNELFKGENYLSAEEALELGIIHEIAYE